MVLWLACDEPRAESLHHFVAQPFRIGSFAVWLRHRDEIQVLLGQLFDRLALINDLLAVYLADLLDRCVMRLAASPSPLRPRYKHAAASVFAVDRPLDVEPESCPGLFDVENVVLPPFFLPLLNFPGHSIQQAFSCCRQYQGVDGMMAVVRQSFAVLLF